MVIDFHTHAFTDKLAKKAIATLLDKSGSAYVPVHEGTLSGLLSRMDEWGIDKSVVLPIVTKETQVKGINEWAISICSKRIECFGSIFPHSDNYKAEIDYVVGLGLKGLKFHAEYQDFVLDDPKMLKVYDYALSKDLVLVHHAGYDPGFPPPFHSSPKQFRNVMREMKGGVIVAAHLGGHAQWDDVEQYLAGSGIYLDTSMGFEYYSREQFLRICQLIGTDRILFGSDSPWSDARSEVEKIRSLSIEEEDKARILGENAMRILK